MMLEPKIFETIRATLAAHDVVLFMKGTRDMPMCGFSAAVVQALTSLDVPFHEVNVLSNEDLRQGIKDFTQWPTIPQLYIKAEFIGGCDIVREMAQTGELQALLKDKGLVAA